MLLTECIIVPMTTTGVCVCVCVYVNSGCIVCGDTEKASQVVNTYRTGIKYTLLSGQCVCVHLLIYDILIIVLGFSFSDGCVHD